MGMFTGLMNWLSARDYSRGALNKPPDIASDDRTLLAWHRTHMANERTFLSWSRTSISLLAFGFVIERFGLFVHMLFSQKSAVLQRSASFWIGLAFIILGAVASSLSVVQYRSDRGL